MWSLSPSSSSAGLLFLQPLVLLWHLWPYVSVTRGVALQTQAAFSLACVLQGSTHNHLLTRPHDDDER